MELPAAAPVGPVRGPKSTRPDEVNLEPAGSLEEQRRSLKVKLLRDLVAHGLYRVPTQALAERLTARMRGARR